MPDTQYFTNIDGKYVKDAEARQQLNDLEDYVESLDQPWTPLQDGYSNFWFELTNDTLSPWLNFSAKTNDAVINWGDGSGEQSLDTLNPTHTYSKAGRYVVKCKGVTRIARQYNTPLNAYLNTLTNVELNSEVSEIQISAFRFCNNLKNIVYNSNTTINQYAFQGAGLLKSITFSDVPAYVCMNNNSLSNVVLNGTTSIGMQAFYGCVSLNNITIPNTVTSIANYSFSGCQSLSEIHIQATTPPTLGGTSVFSSLPSNWICYVPIGYGDTYKAASGWSTYSDHILEEGQQVNRAMLAKFNSAKTDEPQDDMR